MINHAVKFTTDVLYQRVLAAVEADPLGEPLAISGRIVAKLTDEEYRVLAEQLLAQRVSPHSGPETTPGTK